MTNDITNMMGGSSWGMALITALVICAIVLGIVVLIRYLSP